MEPLQATAGLKGCAVTSYCIQRVRVRQRPFSPCSGSPLHKCTRVAQGCLVGGAGQAEQGFCVTTAEQTCLVPEE